MSDKQIDEALEAWKRIRNSLVSALPVFEQDYDTAPERADMDTIRQALERQRDRTPAESAPKPSNPVQDMPEKMDPSEIPNGGLLDE